MKISHSIVALSRSSKALQLQYMYAVIYNLYFVIIVSNVMIKDRRIIISILKLYEITAPLIFITQSYIRIQRDSTLT